MWHLFYPTFRRDRRVTIRSLSLKKILFGQGQHKAIRNPTAENRL